jgi:hypothetical protein
MKIHDEYRALQLCHMCPFLLVIGMVVCLAPMRVGGEGIVDPFLDVWVAEGDHRL